MLHRTARLLFQTSVSFSSPNNNKIRLNQYPHADLVFHDFATLWNRLSRLAEDLQCLLAAVRSGLPADFLTHWAVTDPICLGWFSQNSDNQLYVFTPDFLKLIYLSPCLSGRLGSGAWRAQRLHTGGTDLTAAPGAPREGPVPFIPKPLDYSVIRVCKKGTVLGTPFTTTKHI